VNRYDLDNNQDREDRRKHLELVSKVVDRMAGASAAAKGWSITVAGAAFGVAVVRTSWFIFLLGVGALVVFGILDGLYLHTERKYRDLYVAIVQNEVEPLSMDTTNLNARRKRDSHRSWSVLGFYGPLAFAGLLLMVVAICTGDAKQDQPTSHVPSAPARELNDVGLANPGAPVTAAAVGSPPTTAVSRMAMRVRTVPISSIQSRPRGTYTRPRVAHTR
jgi:hypothetical protein